MLAFLPAVELPSKSKLQSSFSGPNPFYHLRGFGLFSFSNNPNSYIPLGRGGGQIHSLACGPHKFMTPELKVEFWNEEQRLTVMAKERNLCFSGGFGNGKSFAACIKATLFLTTFPNYRIAICRLKLTDLKKTTMQTFFKVMPKEMIASHDETNGVTKLHNGSIVYWLHLDAANEDSLRGLEINAAIIDQPEEIDEAVYLILDSRIGRWDQAKVPENLLKANPDWPKHSKSGRPLVHNWHLLLPNPEDTMHWIYRRYHPESEVREPNHVMFQRGTDPNMISPETYAQMMRRDPAWVAKYMKGEWGVSESQIHRIHPESILDPNLPEVKEYLARIKREAALYRTMDHGETSPTCCTWFGALRGNFVAYREYYVPNERISYHRQAITDLSVGEKYVASYADPSIFRIEKANEGGIWSVAYEYNDSKLKGTPIAWIPADNNEFATRNRINELLARDPDNLHPITGEPNSPHYYFIKATPEYPDGIRHGYLQMGNQRREQIGTDNGRPIYSDDRKESITDHAYDTHRYFVAMHGSSPREAAPKAPTNSFAGMLHQRRRAKARRSAYHL